MGEKSRRVKSRATSEAELSNIGDRDREGERQEHCKGKKGGLELTKWPRFENRRRRIRSKKEEVGTSEGRGKRKKRGEQGERKGTNRGQIKEEGLLG